MGIYDKNMNKICMERTLAFALKQMEDELKQLIIEKGDLIGNKKEARSGF